LLLSLSTAGHCLIYKRDSRAATAWVGLIIFAPILGSILYILLGINRVQRRASGMRGEEATHIGNVAAFAMPLEQLAGRLPHDAQHLIEIARVNTRVTQLDLLSGNRVEPLHNGDEAYPAMLEAIEAAQHSITLATYIFDNDRVGRRFVDALAAAVKRGVETRVLIDAVGARYSLPPVTHRLRTQGVRTARFLPSMLPLTTPYFNLRNHRKIMVVDGAIGFTGGMNIRAHHVLADGGRHATRDLHFRVTGPVVHELQATFVEDWHFTTKEALRDEPWFAAPQAQGDILARAVPDGPDKDYDKMRMAFHGALSVAQRYVRIVTPYFLPDASLVGAINTCAMRGVKVDIVLPEHNNLKLVAWASMAQMWQLLEWGCHIWLTPPPFDHSKMLVMDDYFSLIGSSNWDPRSLRLNFELGLECYDATLARQLNAAASERIARARPLTLDQVDGRRLPVKLRDGAARLLAPYL
jgi:cardiolipin synthase